MNRIVFLFIVHICLCNAISVFAQKNDVNPNGYNEFFYPNGQISSKGTMKDGKPEGYWKTYFPNGNLKSEGNRKNFRLDSLWIFYNENGDTLQKINYLFDRKNGYFYQYAATAKDPKRMYLKSKEMYVDDIKQGKSYYFHENGKIYQIISFKDNKKQGSGREFNTNGDVSALLEFRYDNLVDRQIVNRTDKQKRKQGVWMVFYPNDKIKTEMEYKDDLLNGYVKNYDQSGKLLKMERYVNGELVIINDGEDKEKVNIVKQYYASGNVKKNGGYKNDKPVGVHREFSEDGKIINAETYDEAGILESTGIVDEQGFKQGAWKEYYTTGEIKSEGNYKDNRREGNWIFYHANGNIEQKGKYVKGKPHGSWYWYYQNGKLLREEEFINGKEDGLMAEYTETGDTIVKGNYVEGEKNGKWLFKIGDEVVEGEYANGLEQGKWFSFYYPSLMIKSEYSYNQGELHGEYKSWYENGKLLETGDYVMGKKHKTWIRYDELGNPDIVYQYAMGELQKVDGMEVSVK